MLSYGYLLKDIDSDKITIAIKNYLLFPSWICLSLDTHLHSTRLGVTDPIQNSKGTLDTSVQKHIHMHIGPSLAFVTQTIPSLLGLSPQIFQLQLLKMHLQQVSSSCERITLVQCLWMQYCVTVPPCSLPLPGKGSCLPPEQL